MNIKRIIKLVGAGYTIYSVLKGNKSNSFKNRYTSSGKASKIAKAAKYYTVAKAIAKALR